MTAKTQDAAGETGTMCVCGHEQAKHYFGDEMHTACQAQSVSSREPCRCREYLPVQPPAAPRETALAAPAGETDSQILDRLLVRCAFYFNGVRVRTHEELTAALNSYADDAPTPEAHVLAARVPTPSAPQEPRGEPSEGMVERAWLSECERDPRLKTVDAKSVAGEKAAIRSILRAALSTGGRDAD